MKNFKESQTKTNLMRAFAGESQARNRYTFAAEIAKKQGLYVIEAVFKYTADQELAHANVFMKHLSELNGETVEIDGGYPVEVTNSVIELLENAGCVLEEDPNYDPIRKPLPHLDKRLTPAEIKERFCNRPNEIFVLYI